MKGKKTNKKGRHRVVHDVCGPTPNSMRRRRKRKSVEEEDRALRMKRRNQPAAGVAPPTYIITLSALYERRK